jgi:hypothetical protein
LAKNTSSRKNATPQQRECISTTGAKKSRSEKEKEIKEENIAGEPGLGILTRLQIIWSQSAPFPDFWPMHRVVFGRFAFALIQ